MESAVAYDNVNDRYSRLARETALGNTKNGQKVALSFGYGVEELSSVPEGSNLGVSCGNPLALAGVKEGETIVDLGSGAGFDVFLASRRVGPSGTAIGIDMSKDMLARARNNATKSNITNVKFVESKITNIDLPSNIADCIISNCVINLVPEPDKHLVFEEIYRVLKPGGRLAISDILAKKPFPPGMAKNISLYVGCISGASMVEQYQSYMDGCNFESVMIIDKNVDLNVYKETELFEKEEETDGGSQREEKKIFDEIHPTCCGTGGGAAEVKTKLCCSIGAIDEEFSEAVDNTDFNEWVGSYNVYAIKPKA